MKSEGKNSIHEHITKTTLRSCTQNETTIHWMTFIFGSRVKKKLNKGIIGDRARLVRICLANHIIGFVFGQFAVPQLVDEVHDRMIVSTARLTRTNRFNSVALIVPFASLSNTRKVARSSSSRSCSLIGVVIIEMNSRISMPPEWSSSADPSNNWASFSVNFMSET